MKTLFATVLVACLLICSGISYAECFDSEAFQQCLTKCLKDSRADFDKSHASPIDWDQFKRDLGRISAEAARKADEQTKRELAALIRDLEEMRKIFQILIEH